MMDIPLIVFYLFSGLMLFSAVSVVTCSRPVVGIVALVMAFVSAAVLWLLQHAEFLSLALIFVYVGAVMTLFLFVVMMLNVEKIPALKWNQFSTWLGFLLAIGVCYLVIQRLLHASWGTVVASGHATSNVNALGQVLYTDYVFPFELSAFLLLVAMVSAVALTFRGPRQQTRRQSIDQQVSINPQDRVRMFDLRKDKS